MNECLDVYWTKGAKLVNNLVGVLIPFRENKIAIRENVSRSKC